jgi:hypothetical protein
VENFCEDVLTNRQKAATVLETWDLQAMHALNSGEVRESDAFIDSQSIAQVKLRMMKAMVETTVHNAPSWMAKGKSKQ